MYNFKNNLSTPKKHQKSVHQKTSFTIPTIKKNNVNENITGMVLNPNINSSDSALKSSDINTDLKNITQPSTFKSHQMQAVNKNSAKRKDEKANHSIKKKIKSDASMQKSESNCERPPSKKQNKIKSAFPKTYICKYCCRRYSSVEQLKQHTIADHGNKPTHTCHLCNHQAASFSALMTHYLRHSGNKKDNVEKIYAKSKADFSNIQFNVFSRPKLTLQCDKCKLTFTSKSKYEAHTCSENLKKSEYKCAYCGHVATTVEDYSKHLQTHSDTHFICPYCKHKTLTKQQLLLHRQLCKKRQKSNCKYKCDKCDDFQSKSKKEFNSHLKSCEKTVSSYNCAKCHLEFQERKSYESHILVCKNKDSKQKSCAKKIVKQRKKIKDAATNKNKLLCCVCDCVCYSKSEHEEHERQCLSEMAHKPNEETISLCSNCGTTIEISKLTEHNKICSNPNDIHLEEKSLNIDIHGTRRSTRLVRRRSSCIEDEDVKTQRTRLVRRRSSCFEDEDVKTQCTRLVRRRSSCIEDEDVKTQSARLVHRRSSCIEDEDVKPPKLLKIKISKKPKILFRPKCRKGRQSKNPNNPFLCNYCDFTFCSKSTLLRHKRMHSGNPWYVCQFCGKFFFRKDVYIRHEMNVHKKNLKNVFCCYYCKLCFGQSKLLREHVEVEHKDSAFLPIKPNCSKEICADFIESDIKIKQEAEDPNVTEMQESIISETEDDASPNKNTSLESEYSNLSSFKCSICFQTFENASGIEVHMRTHGNLNNEIDEFSESLETGIARKHPPNIKSVLKATSQISDSISETHNSLHNLSVSGISPEKSKRDVCSKNGEADEIDNEFSEVGELAVHTELSQTFDCKLCSKQFTSRMLFEAHGKTVHKIVDWYQCLVCTACGPKQEMLQHMLMHMCKVGSFVVSNKEDYDKIMLSFHNDGQQEKSVVYSDSNKKQITSVSENINIVSDSDLPPLHEYGMCPCPCIDNSSKQKEEHNEKAFSKKDIVENLSVDSNSKQNEEQNENTCSEKDILENLVDKNDAETFDSCQENSESSADVNSGRNSPSNESRNASMENHSVMLDTQDVCNKSKAMFEEEEILKIGGTDSCGISSPAKEYSVPEIKSSGNSMDDCNETESFSQLRYLLQSPRKLQNQQTPEKNCIYSFSQLENPSFSFDKHNLPLKPSSQESLSSDATNVVHKNELNFDLSKQSVSSNEGSSKILYMQDNNQSITTCLKFDVNQSRSVFSESLITASSNQKIQNCAEMDKNENFFKACPSQSTILDFSDLIQHSFENSSPTEDNIFSYATPKQADLHDNSMGTREEVRTPDCMDMVNYDSSGYNSSVKCEWCNVLLVNHNEQINHKCLTNTSEESVHHVDYQYRPKNTFQSLADVENQNIITDIDNIADKKATVACVEKQTGIFVLTSEAELLSHQKSVLGQSLHSSTPNNECTKCHKTFTDIGELMKHSLTCLKSYFLKSAVNDPLSSPDSIQSLLKKDESKTNFSSFSLNSTSPFNIVPTDLSNQNSENLLKHSLNS